MNKFFIHSIAIIAFILIFICKVWTQDSAIIKWHFPFGYGYQVGLGEFSKRYGGHGVLTIGIVHHMKSLEFGIDIQYLFGSIVKEDVLKNLRTPEGHFLGIDHTLAEVNLKMRGVQWQFIVQKELSMTKSPHHVLIGIRPSWISHWIRFDNPGNNFEPIQGNYRYGYDRLHSGLGISEVLGYRYRSNSGLINFEILWQNSQAITQLKRNSQLDKPGFVFPRQTDILSGISFQWILPIFRKRDPNTLFYQ